MIDQRSTLLPAPRPSSEYLTQRPTDRGLTRRQVWATPRHHRAWRRRTIGVLLAILGLILLTLPATAAQASGATIGIGGAWVTVRAHRIVAASQDVHRG